jgi:hypothetical protein
VTANASRAGFAAVDEDHDAAGLIAALDEQAALPAIARPRAAAIDHDDRLTVASVLLMVAMTVVATVAWHATEASAR